MPESGQEALIVGEELALSDASTAADLDALVYADELARGPSQVSDGDQVILITPGLAQGPSAQINLGDLTGDTATYKGREVSMRIPATNASETNQRYTVDFFEDESQFDSVTRGIAAGETVAFTTTRTKSDVGCYIYTANDSNEHRVCWLNIDPGQLLADPNTVWLGASDTSTVLSLKVNVPDSEGSSTDVTVAIKEEGSQIYSNTKTITPGEQKRFSTSVSKSTEGTFTYTADITDGESGITVETTPVDVLWTNDQRATINLEDFTADPQIQEVGQSVDFDITALNTSDEDYSGYTLNWLENGTEFDDQTQDIPKLVDREYSTTRTKSTAGKYEYKAQDDGPVNTSGTLPVAWMQVSATFDAYPKVVKRGESSQLSCTVVNDDGEDQTVTVEFYEDTTRIDAQSGVVNSGSFQDFLLDVTKDTEQEHQYYAKIQDETGIEAETNKVTVAWKKTGIYADWGEGLVKVNPTSVGGFSAWYDYYESEAHHGNEIRGRGSVTLLDDGSSIGAAVTYDDGNGSQDVVIEATTSFSESITVAQKDDPTHDLDSFGSTAWTNNWNRENTDGGVASFSDGFDITIGVGMPGFFFNEGTSFSGSIRFVDNR